MSFNVENLNEQKKQELLNKLLAEREYCLDENDTLRLNLVESQILHLEIYLKNYYSLLPVVFI